MARSWWCGVWLVAFAVATGGGPAACSGNSAKLEGAGDAPSKGGKAGAANSGGIGPGGTAASGTGGNGATGGASGRGTGGATPRGGGAGVDVGGAGEAGAAGESGAGGEGGTPRPPVECEGKVRLTTTTERCENGLIHRPRAAVCPVPVRDEELGLAGSAGFDCEGQSGPYCRLVRNDCTRDADCGPNQFCIRTTEQTGDADYNYEHVCAGCVTDADCGVGQICSCEFAQQNASRTTVELGVCRPSTCSGDSECLPGYFCMSRPVIDTDRRRTPLQHWEFHCQSPRDECAFANECPKPPFVPCEYTEAVCDYSSQSSRWECGFEPPGGWDDSC